MRSPVKLPAAEIWAVGETGRILLAPLRNAVAGEMVLQGVAGAPRHLDRVQVMGWDGELLMEIPLSVAKEVLAGDTLTVRLDTDFNITMSHQPKLPFA